MTRPLQLAALTLFFVALGACHPPPVQHVLVVKGPPEGVPVSKAPPPALDEVPTEPPPGEGWVWRDGYWDWNEDVEAYSWVPGQWTLPPALDYVFVVGATVFIDGGWLYRPGFWCHRDHRYDDSYRGRPWRPTNRRHGDRHRDGPPSEHANGHGHGKGHGNTPPSAPSKVRARAPASPNTRLRARAPEAFGTAPKPGHTVHAKAPASADGPKHGRTIVLEEQAKDRAVDIHANAGKWERDYRTDPSYRGTRDGRPRFGDSPQGSPRYRRDATGAIVLSDGPRRHRGGLTVTTRRRDSHIRAAKDPTFVRGPKSGTRSYVALRRQETTRAPAPRFSGRASSVRSSRWRYGSYGSASRSATTGTRYTSSPTRSSRNGSRPSSSFTRTRSYAPRSSSRSYSPRSSSRSYSSRSSSSSYGSRSSSSSSSRGSSSRSSSSRSSGGGRRR